MQFQKETRIQQKVELFTLTYRLFFWFFLIKEKKYGVENATKL